MGHEASPEFYKAVNRAFASLINFGATAVNDSRDIPQRGEFQG